MKHNIYCYYAPIESHLLGSKTLGTKCIRTSLCIMLANHDQNVESRFRLAQSVFICKSWNRVIAGFIGLNLQGSIDWKLDLINRTSCKLIFLQNFPTQPKPSLTCRVLCFTLSIKGKTLGTFWKSLMCCVLNFLWDLEVFIFIQT